LEQIRGSQKDKSDRMASTIRHNRARGEHRVESMAEIVVELKRRFWDDKKIAKELGMEPDEVLRLTQVTGLAGLFADREFSEAWEADTLQEVEGEDAKD
jgi:ParB-like chromosome segregation protein Spo0J